jgi:8-oxo-dGTP pyrophosphatase MutT (NUDIX family)
MFAKINSLIKFLRSHHLKNDAVHIMKIYSSYSDEGMVGDKWGSKGSGILFIHRNEMLLLKRSPYVLEPNTWGIPGGAIPKNEKGEFKSDWDSAVSESEEETGHSPERNVVGSYVYISGAFKYTTFFVEVEEKFTPSLNWESSDFAWVNTQDLNQYSLHYGVSSLLKNSNILEILENQNDYKR